MPPKRSKLNTAGAGRSVSTAPERGNPSEHDISFMNTEPLDISVLDTEPMQIDNSDVELVSGDSGSEQGDSENEGSEGDTGDETSVGDAENEASEEESDGMGEELSVFGIDDELALSPSDLSPSDCASNSDEEGTPPPPPVDISMAPSYEVKRIYGELIDSCRGFENETISNSERSLMHNITAGDNLFRQMEMSLSQSYDENRLTDPRRPVLGSSASELFLACQHTNVCSKMLKQAVKNAGAVACAFKLDEFLMSLRQNSMDQEGGYSVLLSVRKLAYTSARVSYSVSHFHTVSGCIDKEELIQKQEPPTPKEAKVRVPRKKDEIKVEDATQKEVMNKSDKAEEKDDEPSTDTADGLAANILKTIKTQCKERQEPQNLLEIAHANDLTGMLSRLFGVAFVVRDGKVALNRRDNASGLETCTALTLKPEKPPLKNGKDDKRRQQYIASFSVDFLRALTKANAAGNK